MLFNNQFKDKIATGPGVENCSFGLSPNRPGCVDFGYWPNLDLFGQSINVDRAVTRGIESSMRFHFLSRFNVQNNYTFTQSEQQSGSQTGQPLVNTPKHMFNSTVRYNATRRLNTWVRIEARSSRTRGTSATALAATHQIGPFSGYSMAHAGAGYQVSKGVIINATVYNLLNTNFLAYMPYVYNRVTNYASVHNNMQEPRRFWLSATYQF
jgi:outer membrane receptor for ferrienterochelin and colicins